MSELNEEFWSLRYDEGKTGWDLGGISRPIKEYIDQLDDKSLKILIPGCGNAHEAEYLWNKGFKNIHLIDLVITPLKAFQKRVEGFPDQNLHQMDFFVHEGQYDLILEQTMFCAIDPKLRADYAKQTNKLLKPGGKLVGVFFGRNFDGGPPFGGSKEEYLEYFNPLYTLVSLEDCYNSVDPRMGSELFVKMTK